MNECRIFSCFLIQRCCVALLEEGGVFREVTLAFVFTKAWEPAVEKNMRDFYDTLSEKEQRRFAAVQARQFGHGGVTYMAKVLGCSRRTIRRGLAELDALPHDPAAGRVRRPGAGRKKKSCPAHLLNSI